MRWAEERPSIRPCEQADKGEVVGGQNKEKQNKEKQKRGENTAAGARALE